MTKRKTSPTITIIYSSFPCLARESKRDIRVKPEYDKEKKAEHDKEKKAEHDKEKKALQFHTEKKRRFSEPQAERHIGSGVHGTAGALGHAAADGTIPVGGVGKNGRLNENPVQKIKTGSEL